MEMVIWRYAVSAEINRYRIAVCDEKSHFFDVRILTSALVCDELTPLFIDICTTWWPY
jgi:hypothetical protein